MSDVKIELMNESKARELLGDIILEDDRLYDKFHNIIITPYYRSNENHVKIDLELTSDQFRALAWWMDHKWIKYNDEDQNLIRSIGFKDHEVPLVIDLARRQQLPIKALIKQSIRMYQSQIEPIPDLGLGGCMGND